MFRPIVTETIRTALQSAASTAVGLGFFALIRNQLSSSPTPEQPVAEKAMPKDLAAENSLSQ